MKRTKTKRSTSKRSTLPRMSHKFVGHPRTKRSTSKRSSTRVPRHVIAEFNRRLDRWTLTLLARSLRLGTLHLDT